VKLLFDQNISFRIINKIKSKYPEARQVKELGLENSTDIEIWNFAKENNYTIVTFNSDFYDLQLIYGHPPKIIWLRTGNTSTNNLVSIFNSKHKLIDGFVNSTEFEDIGCLEID